MKPNQSAPASTVSIRRSSLGRGCRWLLGAAVFAVVLVLFGFFGVPPILKAQLVKRLSAELHREVSIDKIRVNPLVLSLTIEGLAIKDRDSGPFVSWRRLYVNFDSFSFFTGEWRFEEISLDGFSNRVVIARDGTFNFADLIPVKTTESAAPAATKPSRPIRITKLEVTSAALNFADASRPRPFATDVGPVSFTLNHFLTTGDPRAPYQFSAITETGETFAWRGTVSMEPVRSSGDFTLGKIALKKYAPYYADRIRGDLLDGTLDVSAHYAINLGEGSRELTLSDATAKLTNLQVAERGATVPVIELPSLTVTGITADGLKTSARIQRIALEGGRIRVRREADGSINLLTLLTPETVAAPITAATAGVTAPARPAVAPAFPDLKLGEFAIAGLAVDIEDRTTPTPAKNRIEKLDVALKNIDLAAAAAPIAFKAAVAIAPGGSVDIEGVVAREPLTAELAVKITALPLAGFTPYAEPLLNIRIADGTLSVDGKARLAGNVAGFQGDVVVDKFATVDGVLAEDFVKFTSLAIRGIDATSEPLAARIGEIALTDPAARIVVNADKSTNLAAVLRQATAPASGGGAPPAAPLATPTWSVDKFTLANGAITFFDRSIQPGVRMALDQFGGTVTGLSSVNLQRADVDIHGKVDGAGAIGVTGKLDARAATLAEDARTEITIDVKGVDLSPISPYVGTYAGYELARSGLAVDVKASLARRKIDSTNVLTLKQFTFGAPTNSPLATKLPVRLGVALLKDTSGNIVIDLPVEGSLDDPNFRIGRVVWRVITNLLVKAATSPFSLIGSMFGGGGDELAYQEFAAGAATPLEAEARKVETLRKALKGRPALNLDISGSFDATADRDVVRDQRLSQQVRTRLWEELRAKDPATPPPAQITVSPEDEARIVGELYVAKFPQGLPANGESGPAAAAVNPAPVVASKPAAIPIKPAPPVLNSRGQRAFNATAPKPAPVPKPLVFAPAAGTTTPAAADGAPALTLAAARQALAAEISVTDDDLRQLAIDRAQHVRDELLAGGEIDGGRLFLVPPAPQGKGLRVFLQLR